MLDSKITIYLELVELFEKNNHFLFLVGGTVRDYLLGVPLEDMDAVTDATPEEMVNFLDNYDDTFSKYGSLKVVYKNIKFDITTLRKENGYSDGRHPNQVIYTKNLEEDVIRRDLTINALYLDKNLNIIDLVDGKKDLEDKILKLIGDKELRIVEDPLRIIRTLRFSIDYNFIIEEDTYFVIKRNMLLLNRLNKEKIKQEINKCHHKEDLINLIKLMNFNLNI